MKKKGTVGKVIKTILSLLLTVILAVLMFAANVILPSYDRMANSILNGFSKTIDNSGANTEGLDLQYNKADYTKESIAAAEDELAREIAQEGLVLLKNEDNTLPLASDTVFSLFSANSDQSVGGGMMGGGTPLGDVMKMPVQRITKNSGTSILRETAKTTVLRQDLSVSAMPRTSASTSVRFLFCRARKDSLTACRELFLFIF